MSASILLSRSSLRTSRATYRCYALAARNQHTLVRTERQAQVAFVLDIDGVLLRGPNVLPAARKALALLEGDNVLGKRIPYILLTNGGGMTEEERCRRLTRMLGVEIPTEKYMQAHTILRTLVQDYADKPVLVLGGKLDAVRQAAENYGFKRAYTTLDVLNWNPAVWPFHELTAAERGVARRVNFSQIQISAALVFHDPRNWALDVQVLCDVIQSGGIIGGPYVEHSKQGGDPVQVVFCNPDLLWKSDFEHPRLGQGAFREAFQAVYKSLTGLTYPYIQYGKPTRATYQFAESVLSRQAAQLYGATKSKLRIYMIGDNPESDIAGANDAHWSSILVHTGVYDPRKGPPNHTPTHEASDVEEAVRWALEREMGRTAEVP